MASQTVSERTASLQRIELGQKAWKYIRDANSASVRDLAKVAIADGGVNYTYGVMFREWDRYASVFSALGMTGEGKARVGVLGSTCAEVIFATYALNMVGAEVSIVPAYSALTPRKLIQSIMSEHLTDFIVTDDFAQANLIDDLFSRQKRLGLNNIIVLHVPMVGATVNPAYSAAHEMKYGYLKQRYWLTCMESLLDAHRYHPVSYASEESQDVSIILHTSGSTSGTGKPMPLSDAALNAAAAAFFRMDELELPWENLTTAVIVDLSNAYSMVDQMHIPFALGATVVVAPGGILNPAFYKAIPAHRISFLFTVSAMFERWLTMENAGELDFQSLRTVVLGGAAVSASDKHRFCELLEAHGGTDVTILNGYGISELGGACCLSTRDLDDEAIGYTIPGVTARLFDEEQGRFLDEGEAPYEGVLYLNSPSIATSELDGVPVMDVKSCEGKPFVCTNDLARIGEDGKIFYLGRARRYFINDEGRKFDAGRVEAEVARQPGIEACCVAPVYVKTTHDNIPMLCVKCLETAGDREACVVQALRQVFIAEQSLGADNVPSRVLITHELPRNGNGKIDLYRIGRGDVEGDVFTVEEVRIFGKLTNYRLKPYHEGPADMIQEVFDGISAELKSGLPGFDNKEEDTMSDTADIFGGFNAMNTMGRQMMDNVMGKMNPTPSAEGAAGGIPDVQQLLNNMMPNVQAMVGNVAPNVQEMVGNMMPKMGDQARGTAQSVLPAMQQQVEQAIGVMTQMNQFALSAMETVFTQGCAMMSQAMEGASTMAGAAPAAEGQDATEAADASAPGAEPEQ